MTGIIWLASYPKSGNTWLRAFLANYLSQSTKAVPINDLPKFILGDNLALHYAQFTGREVDDMSAEEIARLRPQIHEWFARSRQEDVFVKTHNAVALADGVPLITPQATAGAVYAVRNPLDVAVSFAHHYQIDYERAVESLGREDYRLPAANGLLPQYLGSWSRHVASWTQSQGLTLQVVRYEDLIRDPVKSFTKVIKFLGLPVNKQRLRMAVKFSSFKELSKQERSSAFVESRPDGKTAFFRQGEVGAWREALDEGQIARLVSDHRAAMTAMGYLDGEGRLVL
ncbi:MAG: sulfotransferase domain-containing protein [Pseudomonadota bacterium]